MTVVYHARFLISIFQKKLFTNFLRNFSLLKQKIYAKITLVIIMCISMLLLGLPCPGCGLTRANILFFTGKFYEAFMMHPLFLVADVFLLYLLWRLIKRKKATKPFLILCLVLFALFFVVFVIRWHFLFGKCEPFIVNENSLLSWLVSLSSPR